MCNCLYKNYDRNTMIIQIEQDYRRVKHRIRAILGFKSDCTASIILEGIELIHTIRKGQMAGVATRNPSFSEQFNLPSA